MLQEKPAMTTSCVCVGGGNWHGAGLCFPCKDFCWTPNRAGEVCALSTAQKF